MLKFYNRHRDVFLHLRLSFSFFLLPVFLFGLSEANELYFKNIILVLIILHFFIYPASNMYNSFMDKDTGSIGGLKNPPPVSQKMYYTSIALDLTGLLLCTFISGFYVLLMGLYILISKAYSWDKIRLKKYGIAGWLIVMLFQGGYTFMLVNIAAQNNISIEWLDTKNMAAMIFSSLLIGGYYPLTQIYQHEEDKNRGDITISYQLGIKGTFLFTASVFTLAVITAYIYFIQYHSINHFALFVSCLIPVMLYFVYWAFIAFKNPGKANYQHAMRMMTISSSAMIVCFLIMFAINQSDHLCTMIF
jgi:4-hydroxybenzoate polyprenyltransferase